MNIGKILKATGKSLLKEVPLGGVIMDIAEMVVGKELPRDTLTGEELGGLIESLPAEQKLQFLNKTIDSELAKFTAWTELKTTMEEETPSSRARAYIAMMIAVVIVFLSAGFGAMLGQQYLENGRMPSVEELLIVFGVPSLALLSFFGIRVGPLQELVVNALLHRIAKRR
jgi:hypothetical protein